MLCDSDLGLACRSAQDAADVLLHRYNELVPGLDELRAELVRDLLEVVVLGGVEVLTLVERVVRDVEGPVELCRGTPRRGASPPIVGALP